MSRRRWLWALTAAGLVAKGFEYQNRLAALRVVPRAASPREGPGRYSLVAARGVELTAEQIEAATAYAESEGLDLLDLVPEGLDAERALDLARQLDPATYRRHRMARGRSAHHAVLVDDDLLARMERKATGEPVAASELADLVAEAKRFAPTACDLAVLPGFAPVEEDPAERRAVLGAAGDEAAPVAAVVGLGFLGAGLVAAPAWGLLALAGYCAQPVIALRGSPLRPPRAPWRPRRSLARALGTARSGGPAATDDAQLDEARSVYRDLLAAGTERFFEPRRVTCAWCEWPDLTTVLDSPDIAQHKPGRFRLDRCRECGHVFQNPRLTQAGLDFYYRDFYSGPWAHALTGKFQADEPLYRKRADIVRRHYDGEPERWLDVGTGHGHFCLVARDAFPRTRFEALDMGDAVVTAERRGWVEQAHHGEMPAFVDELAGRFDVVSIHHCLEHQRDPRQLLADLKRTLRPGGYLSIEVPDPECRAGRLLGRAWGPWFQPQHQHMAPIRNLCEELGALGFDIVATERREAHEQFEASLGALLLLDRWAPDPRFPWRSDRPGALARRTATMALGMPALLAAAVLDHLLDPVVRRLPGGPNAYRVLARLDDPAATSLRHPATWKEPLLAALSDAAGTEVAYAAGPTALDATSGPWAYVCELTSADPGWRGARQVRLGLEPELRAEAEALRLTAGAGLRVPSVRALTPVAGDEAWALVTTRPEGIAYPALVPPNLGQLEELFVGFAHYQAALHDRTADASEAAAAVPLLDLDGELGRIDAGRFGAELRWLRDHVPEPAPTVLCHGAYEMNAVFGPGPETWADHGGPGQGLMATNWFDAVRAEREYDVGLTLVTFWVAPLFIEHRPARAPLRMMRNNLASSYRRAYGEVADLDRARLGFWQAFHTVRGMAAVDGACEPPASPFRRTDHRALPKGLGKELRRLYRMITAKAQRGF